MIVNSLTPLISIIFDLLITFGTIQLGRILSLKSIFKDELIFNLIFGFLFITQFIFIYFIILKSNGIFSFVAYSLLILGLYYLYFTIRTCKINIKLFKIRSFLINSNLEFKLTCLLISLFLILSILPPTNADALHYHLGIPLFILNYNNLPPLNLWLHGNAGGLGEIYNAIGLSIGTTNLGKICQVISLLFLITYITRNITHNFKYIIYLFILSSPVLLFLVTTSKFQLFPQVLTTLSLYLLIHNKKLNFNLFLIISLFLIGASQIKLSFLLTGGLIAIFAIFKLSKNVSSKIIFSTSILFLIFFVPRGIHNLMISDVINFKNFFSPLPYEFLNHLNSYRENEFIFPLNLFIPESLGRITAILGFQFFIILFLNFKNKTNLQIIGISLIAIFIVYFLSMPISRVYYEILLWLSLLFCFININQNILFKFKLLLYLQCILLIAGSLFGAFSQSKGILNKKLRDDVLHKYAYEYSAFNWANQLIPKGSIVLTNMRSVSFLNNKFLPADWVGYPKINSKYYDEIKKKQPNFILYRGKKNISDKCYVKKYYGSKQFLEASRNPFNSGSLYTVKMFHIDPNKCDYTKLGLF